MAVIDDKIRQQVEADFAKLKEKVKLVVFTQEFECQTCKENHMLAEEVAALSGKISLEVHDFAVDKDQVQKYNVDKIPAIVVMGEKDYGVRFYGLPEGYEFGSLMEVIKAVSARDSGLAPRSRELLRKLVRPVHIQVFVTLTCPYCPQPVRLAHQFAIESDLVRADMVECAEFPHLTNRYKVLAVPKVIINEKTQFEGSKSESDFLELVTKVSQGRAS